MAPSYLKYAICRVKEFEKNDFFGIPHFSSMTEPSKDINYNKSFNVIVSEF